MPPPSPPPLPSPPPRLPSPLAPREVGPAPHLYPRSRSRGQFPVPLPGQSPLLALNAQKVVIFTKKGCVGIEKCARIPTILYLTFSQALSLPFSQFSARAKCLKAGNVRKKSHSPIVAETKLPISRNLQCSTILFGHLTISDISFLHPRSPAYTHQRYFSSVTINRMRSFSQTLAQRFFPHRIFRKQSRRFANFLACFPIAGHVKFSHFPGAGILRSVEILQHRRR